MSLWGIVLLVVCGFVMVVGVDCVGCVSCLLFVGDDLWCFYLV